MRIGIIGCSKTKLKGIHKAKDMYRGHLHRKSWELARLMKLDKIYIISTFDRLIDPEEYLHDYDEVLDHLTEKELKEWASRIEVPNGELYYFAGQRYIKYLPKGHFMYKGKKIGYVLQHLDNEIRRLKNE